MDIGIVLIGILVLFVGVGIVIFERIEERMDRYFGGSQNPDWTDRRKR
jgi:hypothetical protein